MSILKTSKLGNPVLREGTRELSLPELKSLEIQNLIDDMIATMHEYDGVGLAAPQVHRALKIAVIESNQNPRYPGAPQIPLLVLVNPRFVSLSKELQTEWEGCLSVDGFRGKVPRSKEIEIHFLDRNGQPCQLKTTGFRAVVIQHELDHLDGKVFLDRMKDLKTLTHLLEYEKFWMEPDP